MSLGFDIANQQYKPPADSYPTSYVNYQELSPIVNAFIKQAQKVKMMSEELKSNSGRDYWVRVGVIIVGCMSILAGMIFKMKEIKNVLPKLPWHYNDVQVNQPPVPLYGGAVYR